MSKKKKHEENGADSVMTPRFFNRYFINRRKHRVLGAGSPARRLPIFRTVYSTRRTGLPLKGNNNNNKNNKHCG